MKKLIHISLALLLSMSSSCIKASTHATNSNPVGEYCWSTEIEHQFCESFLTLKDNGKAAVRTSTDGRPEPDREWLWSQTTNGVRLVTDEDKTLTLYWQGLNLVGMNESGNKVVAEYKRK